MAECLVAYQASWRLSECLRQVKLVEVAILEESVVVCPAVRYERRHALHVSCCIVTAVQSYLAYVSEPVCG